MSTITQSKVSAGYEPIPGYVLKRLLGSGGFGEVWLASAPGGLEKAVKLVFGTMEEKRANRELKSLERIRGVNHPFLLTLERFEVVDSQLVIVTELADGSLEEIYQQHIERGSCGIPRKSLLVYMNDAADGLDYLSAAFRLQHLDVKPANLLLVGGHVKVADFGLLKDLREVEHSVVGGLTPIYAAPEVFDGRPSATSDQYSLAIMYQELLTGVRPFSGRTIAQLATQHVHSSPNLEPLPPTDRPVVARALEKNAERRFGSCMEFVEALRQASGGNATSVRVFGRPAETSPSVSTSVSGTILTSGEVQDLGDLSADISQFSSRAVGHALVVGLGGIGAECLQYLRAKAGGAEEDQSPALHTVLIDTDVETVGVAQLAETNGRLVSNLAIHTPLKSSHEYRQAGTNRLATISRRWVYNVPRTGATEGLRPLGRLAMVDHGRMIADRLANVVGKVLESCGQQVPHIYLVTSLDGGTGGGMVWDVAYLLRHLLDQAGLAEAELIPVLAAPPLRGSGKQQLLTADTYAALAELQHYLKPGNCYPGDAGAGWPSVPAARSPLVDAYVVARADGEQGRGQLVESIGNYIWADSTQAGSVLAVARKQSSSEPGSVDLLEPAVRSFGICPLDSSLRAEQKKLLRSLAWTVVRQWSGKPGESKQQIDQVTEELVREAKLDLPVLQQAAWGPLSALEAERAQLLLELVSKADPQVFGSKKAWGKSQATGNLDCLLEQTNFRWSESEEDVARNVQAMLVNVRQALAGLLRSGEVDLEATVDILKQLSETVISAAQRYQLSAPRRQQEAQEVHAALLANAGVHSQKEMLGSVAEPGPVIRYLELRLQAAVDQKLAIRLSQIPPAIEALIVAVKLRRQTLQAAAKLIANGQSARGGAIHEVWKRFDDLKDYREQLETTARQSLAADVLAVDDLETPYAATASDVQQTVLAGLEMLVEEAVRASAEETQKKLGEEGSEAIVEESRRLLEAIRPAMLACGGRQRLVLIVGDEEERQRYLQPLSQALGRPLSVVLLPGVAPVLVHEAQRIPVASLLQRYQMYLGSDPKIVGKLKTRCDISWSSSDLQ
ncbi:protein kinase domain-containing protein [Planctomycetaceae bacterium SH139]